MRTGACRRRGVNRRVSLSPGDGPNTAIDLIPAIGADGSLFAVEKMQAHRSGQLHLAVSVFLFCGDEMLIQRRALGKYHCGGMWANSCCTHPHWGETLAAAARRRTRQELGVAPSLAAGGILTYCAPVGGGLIEHERVQLYRGEVDKTRLRLAPDPDEVIETGWVTRQALAAVMQARPQDYAPGFRIYISRWSELGFVTPRLRGKAQRAGAQQASAAE
jgi:isopentenyl-diphosphate delta-isomerase